MTGCQQIALQLSFEFLEKRIQLNDLLLKLVKIVLDRITIRGPKHVQDVIFSAIYFADTGFDCINAGPQAHAL